MGYFTMNPKKLVLPFSDFSVIFYAIHKNHVGDSPRGPLKQQGNPQLKTRNKAKHA
jgi:hypothetical protein